MTSRVRPDMSLEEAVRLAVNDKLDHVVRCPGHDDGNPSLRVSPGRTQPCVIKCYAECDPADIIAAAGIDWDELCHPLDALDRPSEAQLWTPEGTASHLYPYHDEKGILLYEVLRVDKAGGKKRFFQRQPDAAAPHGHRWNLDGVDRTIYRLPQVLRAVRAGRTVHVAEGEKCVHALLRAIPEGDEATCNPQGAGKWLDYFGQWLAGANVVVYADIDDVGRQHARSVRENLLSYGATVEIREPLPGYMEGGKAVGDVADHLSIGRALEDLLVTTPQTMEERARTGIDLLDLIKRPRSRIEWCIDGTLAKGERCVVVGFEGSGKSTLLRQIAVQVAAGMHPFTGLPMEPRKVLVIDAENHPDQVQDSWAQLVGLAARNNFPVERGMLTILEEWEQERALDQQDGKAWLTERLHGYKPDLVIMGPLTNMSSRDLRDDEPVRRIKNAVNEARMVCNSAFIMEHHAPHKGPMDKERVPRPYGSSQFLKWPDYGFGLKPTETSGLFEWYRFRGQRVRSRQWPAALREGIPNTMEFPWCEAEPV